MLFQKQQGVISCIKTNFFSLDLSQQKFTQIFFTPTHISPEIFRWIEHEYFELYTWFVLNNLLLHIGYNPS